MIFDKNIVTTLAIISIMAGSNAIKTHRKSTHIHFQNKILHVFGGNWENEIHQILKNICGCQKYKCNR